MSLAPYVRILGRGPGRSRSLTQDEAQDAMQILLSGEAAPEAVGALLMLMRMRGETAGEIAGFAAAAQAACLPLPPVDLDWPSYAAGRSRGLPWFLLSARLVARAGYRLLIHGRNGSDEAVRAHLSAAGIPEASSAEDVLEALTDTGIAYVPLEVVNPALFGLLALRDVLGLRSCINTVCRMLNPARAATSVQGVFHPSYRLLQSDAAGLLGWPALSAIKGGGGEFERHPGKDCQVFGQRAGQGFDRNFAAMTSTKGRLAEGPKPGTTLASLWDGSAEGDDFAEAVVTGTAALALEALGAGFPAETARRLWQDRLRITETA